ncbi:MAG: RNA polymerase subunit sigma-70 [Acidobacteriaceae bacterium]|nr:RNA polymerase subunit sigma-70 [Acidobacteriaceae bacterium]
MPSNGEDNAAARGLLDEVARRSYGKLIAFLAVRTRNVAAAEDALSEAFASALAHWQKTGCPSNPEAWLLSVARRKSIDSARERYSRDRSDEDVREIAALVEAPPVEADIPDRRLALMFTCAHPAIDVAVRAPLMLQAVLGLDAARIASAFLTSPEAMGKRLVRAKNKIREAGISFRIPERAELQDRLDAVLDAIYAAFTEGWADPSGTDAFRRDLTEEAIFLARVVTELLPQEPEPLGLLALMLHSEARRRARRDTNGAYVPLADQDAALWEQRMIDEAEELLRRACAMGNAGRYQLEGALQSAHVARCRTSDANWADIVRIYDALFEKTGSPVVAMNRALAIAEVDGAEAALAAMPDLAVDPRLAEYQPYWAARARLLTGAHQWEEARQAYEIAIGLERDDSIRCFLWQQQQKLPM